MCAQYSTQGAAPCAKCLSERRPEKAIFHLFLSLLLESTSRYSVLFRVYCQTQFVGHVTAQTRADMTSENRQIDDHGWNRTLLQQPN